MDNKFMPYEDWEFVRRIVGKSNFIFAKTMPQCPHYYMLRKESVDSEFVRFVEIIRKYGYRYKFGNVWYVQLNVNSWYYWTMGAHIDQTILINRKKRELGLESPYDNIAEDYEIIFKNDVSIDEDVQNADFISRHKLSGDTLEIGCGNGVVTRNLRFNKDGYLGIDPSIKMLSLFKECEELSGLKVAHTDFESLNTKQKFDFVFSTYGAASYVKPEFWERLNHLLNPKGSFVLSFYDDTYVPFTHTFTQTHIQYHSANDFPEVVNADIKKVRAGNYILMEGIMR